MNPNMLPRSVIGYFRVTMICFAFALVVAAGTYFFVQRSSDRLDAARKHSDQQFSKALIVTDRKFRQALAVTNAQSAYSINKSVCGFRGFVNPTLKSYENAAKDKTLTPSARARNDLRIRTTRAFLDTQVTVPSDFNCSALPKNPPKPAAP